jgi:hypothetical protein
MNPDHLCSEPLTLYTTVTAIALGCSVLIGCSWVAIGLADKFLRSLTKAEDSTRIRVP